MRRTLQEIVVKNKLLLPMHTPITLPNHYEILSLPLPTTITNPTTALTPSTIKLAYKRALLLHHPDKTLSTANKHPTSTSNPTVDQITQAYQTLSNPAARVEYNRTLLLTLKAGSKLSHVGLHHSGGLETIDLDDLGFDEQAGEYYLSCRCGRERGYTITEEQLERHAEDGEICVECEGCSLWMRVEFGVMTEENKQGDVG